MKKLSKPYLKTNQLYYFFSMVPGTFCWGKCNNFHQCREMSALGNRNMAARFTLLMPPRKSLTCDFLILLHRDMAEEWTVFIPIKVFVFNGLGVKLFSHFSSFSSPWDINRGHSYLASYFSLHNCSRFPLPSPPSSGYL